MSDSSREPPIRCGAFPAARGGGAKIGLIGHLLGTPWATLNGCIIAGNSVFGGQKSSVGHVDLLPGGTAIEEEGVLFELRED